MIRKSESSGTEMRQKSDLKQKLAAYDCEVCDRECDVLHRGKLPLCSGCFGEVLRL